MESEELVLCGSSIYELKFYFNEEKFGKLPSLVKKELHAMCGAFTQEIGGIMLIKFDPEGNLRIETSAVESDILYDEIGCGLKVAKLQRDKRELFEQLELFYKVFIKGENLDISTEEE